MFLFPSTENPSKLLGGLHIVGFVVDEPLVCTPELDIRILKASARAPSGLDASGDARENSVGDYGDLGSPSMIVGSSAGVGG